MKVEDLMSREIKTISSSDNLRNAIKIMKKLGVSRLLVTRDGKIDGILTERDVSDRLGRLETIPISDAHVHVSSAYAEKLIAVGGDADIKFAANKMLENKISSLAVVDAGGKVVGLITKTDLIKSLAGSKTPVAECMSRKFVSLKVGSSLLNARKLMLDTGVKRILVLFDLELAGVVTEGDIAHFLGMFRKVSKGVQWHSKLKEVCVDDIMTRDVLTVGEGDTVGHAVKRMGDEKISGLPVVNGENKVVGLITKTDMLKEVVGG